MAGFGIILPRRSCVRYKREGPGYVAVSVSPGVPSLGNGQRNLRNHEICDWLQQWGFEIDEQTQVPPPDRTVNAGKPISMAGGRADLVELLTNAVPRPIV